MADRFVTYDAESTNPGKFVHYGWESRNPGKFVHYGWESRNPGKFFRYGWELTNPGKRNRPTRVVDAPHDAWRSERIDHSSPQVIDNEVRVVQVHQLPRDAARGKSADGSGARRVE